MDLAHPDRASSNARKVEFATAIATGIATAALPPQRWPRGLRNLIHVGTGAAMGGGAVGVAATADRAGKPGLGARNLAGIGVGAGLLGSAVSAAGVYADGAIERRLLARGVRRPRLWMGLGTAALMLLVTEVERRWSPDANDVAGPAEATPPTSTA